MNKTQSITEYYYSIYDEYCKKFGRDRTLVLMQVGSFYEVYTDYKKERGPDLEKLEEITDTIHTKKNKNNDESPYMWGFPLVATTKFIDILIENNYHLIMVDQVTPPPKPERKVVAIYSPAIYMNDQKLLSGYKSNFIVNIIIDEISQINQTNLTLIGMSAVDISTGEVYIHETISKIDDDKLGLDESARFINSLNPKEIIITMENQIDITNEYLVEYLELEKTQYQFKEINKSHMKVSYQRKFLQSIFNKSNNMNDILDTLDLATKNYARKSLVLLLNYISDHYEGYVSGLLEPIFYLNSSHMTLGNDAVNQLNIIDTPSQTNTSCKNLLDVINKAKTNMGKRYTKMRLVSPYTDPDKLQKIYSIVSILLKDEYFKTTNNYLKSIADIERLERKVLIGNLHPSQLVELIRSYKIIIELFETIKKHPKLKNKIKTSKLRSKIRSLNKLLNKMINCEKAKLFNLNDIKENIFNEGIYPNIDELQEQIAEGETLMTDVEQTLNKYINTCSKSSKMIELKYNKNDGYYFKLSKNRYKILEQQMKEKKNKFIVNKKEMDFGIFDIRILNNDVKLKAPFLKNHSNDIKELSCEITQQTHKYYMQFLDKIKEEYSQVMKETTRIITLIDYYSNIAYISKEYNYTKPIIKESTENHGYIIANQIRHAIVERIVEHEYIPHDINIGNDLKGMLIYGLNSAGKSVLMKAIGISIIMAQAGFFVPASKYTYYPYKAMYTRITGNDNLFRGLSSFSLEMVELNSILKRANPDTLIIGDEVCRGTEHISGNALVASSLLHLSDKNATFVFATHLHEMMKLEEIQNRKNIKPFHLSVDINPNTYDLVYDRILKEGSGERIYGILVAKNIIRDTKFINKALEIKNLLLDLDPESSSIPTKESRYNKKKIMDKCEICGKKNTHKNPTPLETHHINFQKDCENGFVKSKPHLKKNHISNLAVLCQTCHDKLHNNEIDIESIKMTGAGKKLMITKK
jgi:DNA mismatch repair protein MutS